MNQRMVKKSLKDRIIETSLRLFEENGFHKVTVDQIVKESGTSKGGFYHNFKSKDELLYTVHDHFISYVLEKGQQAYQTFATPTEKLDAIIRSFVMMMDLYRSEVTVFYQESSYLAPEYFSLIEEKRDQYKGIMFKVIQDGIDLGEFRKEVPVPIMAMAIFGMINWIYKWYQKTSRYSIKEIAVIYSDLILKSILTPETMQKPAYSRFFLASNDIRIAPI